jgi:UDP-4-amino-4,6-dideoxy-N-acetyl-beta-L-altrosamine transaminase
VIPYGRQSIADEDIQAVLAALRSDFLTQGPLVPQFEEAVSSYCGAFHAIAVNSATSALHIACLALDLGPGDWLWTSPNTFVASANCGLYCGSHVDFVDIDPQTYCMSADALMAKLKDAEKKNLLPKVVIPVHFAGQPCDMPKIFELSRRYGFSVIEDASHAIGATFKGVKVGSCRHSDITVFSFHPVKIITTGEGGMVVTNKKALSDRLRRLRTHGITSDPNLMHPRPPSEIWNYQQIEIGFNYRMTDIEAALGLSQLKRIDYFIERRRELAKCYDDAFKDLPLTLPFQLKGTSSSYHLYTVVVNQTKSSKTQRQIYSELQNSGIGVNLHYIPVHRQPVYEALGFKDGDFPVSEDFHRNAISLPIYPDLSFDQQKFVIRSVRQAILRT